MWYSIAYTHCQHSKSISLSSTMLIFITRSKLLEPTLLDLSCGKGPTTMLCIDLWSQLNTYRPAWCEQIAGSYALPPLHTSSWALTAFYGAQFVILVTTKHGQPIKVRTCLCLFAYWQYIWILYNIVLLTKYVGDWQLLKIKYYRQLNTMGIKFIYVNHIFPSNYFSSISS